MNLLNLSWKNVWARKLSSIFTVLILVIGTGISLFIYQVSAQVQRQFENNIKGIDMVVGAKGSPLQLILSAVFQIDTPTGNIPLDEADKIAKNRFVGKAIPLSYGDSYQGLRIVGTDTSYLRLYQAELAAGQLWNEEMEVVLGAAAAAKLGLGLGDSFLSAHGLESEGMAHDEAPYQVTGILHPTNSVLDNLILTASESIWHVHGGHEADEVHEITALLVKFRSPMGLIRMPRAINQGTNMQAALPSFEINKLFSMLGVGIDVINYIGWMLLIVAGVSFWINLSLSLQDRSYELAVLRTYGATRGALLISIVTESVWLSLTGSLLGILCSQIGMSIFNETLAADYGYELAVFEPTIVWLYMVLAVLTLGVVSSLAPAIKSIRKEISTTLTE